MKRTQEQKDIEKLYDHARIANEEMTHIKNDISDVKADVAIIKENIGWLREAISEGKKALDKFDSRTWVLLSSIILGTLLSIAVSIYN